MILVVRNLLAVIGVPRFVRHDWRDRVGRRQPWTQSAKALEVTGLQKTYPMPGGRRAGRARFHAQGAWRSSRSSARLDAARRRCCTLAGLGPDAGEILLDGVRHRTRAS